MSFNDELRWKAQTALKPYLEGGNSFQVKNPIILLNYLYQHAIIPSPKYCVIPTTQNQSQHAVSCVIGDIQIIGTGESKKVAKNSAAQQFLELFLKPVDISRVSSSPLDVDFSSHRALNVYAANTSDSVNGDGARASQNRVSFSSIKKRMKKSASKKNRIAEPQMAQDVAVHVRSQSNVFPEETMGKISVNNFQIAPSLTAQQSKCNSAILSKDILQMSIFPTACNDFFDPFLKQRPPNSNGAIIKPPKSKDAIIKQPKSKDMIVEINKTESPDQSMEIQPSHTESIPSVVEDKNVFALLQKKTQKHLKLIPRFQTEDIESGFRCSVQLGSYYASGEGRNKKMAKTKAAISLLNQINDSN